MPDDAERLPTIGEHLAAAWLACNVQAWRTIRKRERRSIVSNDELMELAEVIYTAWREEMHAQMTVTLWPWIALHRWEQRQWLTIAAKTLHAVAEIGHLAPV